MSVASATSTLGPSSARVFGPDRRLAAIAVSIRRFFGYERAMSHDAKRVADHAAELRSAHPRTMARHRRFPSPSAFPTTVG